MTSARRRIGFLPREPSHSGGAASADRTILAMVTNELRTRGAVLEELDAERLRHGDAPDACAVLSMARSIENLTRLTKLREHIRIINDPIATLHTLRDRMYPCLAQADIGLPPTQLVDVRQPLSPMAPPYWLKRRDYHHLLRDDVVRIDNDEALERARSHFVMQDHPQVFQQAHVVGKNVKAYGVYDRRRSELVFFATREQLSEGTRVQLTRIARDIVSAIPLEVFGADFVLSDDGPALVDVNAWPSFRQCMQPAAAAIADMVWAATS